MPNSIEDALPLIKEKWAQKSKSARYANDPVLWMEEIAGFRPWRAQREIAYSVRDNRATAVAAAHAVGKTELTGYLVCWWADIHPIDEVFIATTAPSQDQVRLIWDVVRRCHARIAQRHKDGLIDHELPGYITGDNMWKLPNGLTIGQGRKPPDNKSDVAFQGRHAPWLLAIADEAVGVPGGFLEALGNIATGRNNRQLLIANPTDPTCAMARIWKEEDPQWTRMHISVLDSPTIKPEEGFDPAELAAAGMSGIEYIEQKRQEYGGEDDPRYVSRVLGQWAFDAGNNLITQEELAKGKNCIVEPDTTLQPELGLDIARMGGDSSVIYKMERGEVWETDDETGKPTQGTGRTGYRLRKLSSWQKAPLSGRDPNNPSTAMQAHNWMRSEGAWALKLDASGIGAGVLDGLSEMNDYVMGKHGYIWFEVYGQATKEVDRRMYENRRAQEYFRIKSLLHSGLLDIDPADATLIEDLEGVVFEHTSMGRIKIESKDDMKKRGVKSPDHADAAWYALLDLEPLLNQPKAGTTVHLDEDMDFSEMSDWGGFTFTPVD